jgi:hypothetical protein
MTKRYSPLTVVVLMGAFALLGYMGARLSQQEALLTKAGPPPAAHSVDKTTVAPAERDGMQWKRLATATPAGPAKAVAEPADPSAQARSVAAAPLPTNESVRARTTVSPATPEPKEPTPPAVLLNQESVASDWGQTGPGQAVMLTNRAHATNSEERHSRFSERTATARQPALSADDAPVEKSRIKRAGTHQSRHRDAGEISGLPSRSRARRYAAREDRPAPPAPGFRLLPFLPIFLPF